MKLLIQRMIVLFILVIGLSIVLEQVIVNAQPNVNTVTYLPYVSKPQTPTPTPTITPTPTPRPLIKVGPAGGSGGNPFQDNPPDTSYVTEVWIHSGFLVDKVLIWMNTGPLDEHGGAGGDAYHIVFDPDEYMVALNGRICKCYGFQDFLIEQIGIQTNKRTYGPYGGSTGASFSLAAPTGYEIVGFFGRAGQLVDQIGGLARIHR